MTVTHKQVLNDYRRLRRSPDLVDVHPEILATAPQNVLDALAAREAAHNAWIDAEDAAAMAVEDVNQADARDVAALRAAVRNNEPDPGVTHRPAAERALLVAVEKLRLATSPLVRANALLAARYKEHLKSCAGIASKALYDAIKEYDELAAELQSRSTKARDQLHHAYDVTTAVDEALGLELRVYPRTPQQLQLGNYKIDLTPAQLAADYLRRVHEALTAQKAKEPTQLETQAN